MAETITPMVKQYQEIKSRHKDAILFYRLGDFYEMFNEDAKTASRELQLTLTGRGEGSGRMPMCGIPYHAALNYISKLLSKGYKVAICEQVEDPSLAKGVVKREVVKVITPGTVQEEKMLDEKKSNYLLAVSFSNKAAGLAFADASTGEFKLTQIPVSDGIEALLDEIKRIEPSEVLVPDIMPDLAGGIQNKLKDAGFSLTTYKDTCDLENAKKGLKEYFGVASLDSFGLKGFEGAIGASLAILEYLKQTQKGALSHINRINPYDIGDFMYLDQSTKRNLELFSTIRERLAIGSLIWVLDRTVTPMGGRLLKKWLSQPLLDIDQINLRLDAVEELDSSLVLREELSDALNSVSDIERLAGRIASGAANARDLASLRQSLENIPKIKQVVKDCGSSKIMEIKQMHDPKDLIEFISRAIVDDPPHTLKEGNLIKKGFDEELDKLKDLAQGGKEWIAQLETRERQRTGIKSLKVGYTSVFGYYIEASKSNLAMIPPDYIRKQTLVNCERYITPELKEKESMILNAEEMMFKKEYEVFTRVREKVAEHTRELQLISCVLAELDVLLSFSKVSAENRYSRPTLKEGEGLRIKEGRHPVVEKTIGDNMFVANDTNMSFQDGRFMLITGPNMAGKSTYMRQVALICIMAQIGSFVPANSATLPVIDRIFTRIGAMDDIYLGQSTFMVEMTETANILNNATSRSLIILDEIGRGTSTFDGMSIAAAVAEYIHKKINAFTLFATHYHEITQLASKHPGIKNYNTLVDKEGDNIVFLHKIVEGPTDQSYGIEVAKLAGLPEEVIGRAKEIYQTLEMVESGVAGTKKQKQAGKDQMGLF